MLQALRDSRIRSLDDLREAAGGLGVIGVIPKVKEWVNVEASLLGGAGGQRSAVGEAFRSLRTSTQFLNQDRMTRLIEITSPLVDEGKTSIATNLAVSLAQAGHSVILVDCDFHRPRVHSVFKIPNVVGVTSVLANTATLEDACASASGVPNLTLLPAGPIPPNPSGCSDRVRIARCWHSWGGPTTTSSSTPPPAPCHRCRRARHDGVRRAARVRCDEDDEERPPSGDVDAERRRGPGAGRRLQHGCGVRRSTWLATTSTTSATSQTARAAPEPNGTSPSRAPMPPLPQRAHAEPRSAPTGPSAQPRGDDPPAAGTSPR